MLSKQLEGEFSSFGMYESHLLILSRLNANRKSKEVKLYEDSLKENTFLVKEENNGNVVLHDSELVDHVNKSMDNIKIIEVERAKRRMGSEQVDNLLLSVSSSVETWPSGVSGVLWD